MEVLPDLVTIDRLLKLISNCDNWSFAVLLIRTVTFVLPLKAGFGAEKLAELHPIMTAISAIRNAKATYKDDLRAKKLTGLPLENSATRGRISGRRKPALRRIHETSVAG